MPRPVRSLRKTDQLMIQLGADPTLTAAAVDAVGALILKSRRADRRLCDPAWVPRDRMAAAIAKASGRTVSGVVVAPKKMPVPRESGVGDAVYAQLVRDSIGKSATEGISRGATDRFWKRAEKTRRVADWMRIHDSLWYGIRPHLATWAYEDFADGLSGRVAEFLDAVTRGLMGFALIGDAEGLDMLLPLARLMTSAVPVGRSTKNDDEWIVLAG